METMMLDGDNPTLMDGPIPFINEAVMERETRITATTPLGTVAICAGKGLKRSITWNGESRSIEMVPRSARWFGSLGLTWRELGEHTHDPVHLSIANVDEGLQQFKSLERAIRWIHAQTKIMTYVWRNDGLMVGMAVDSKECVLNSLTIWQVLVNGEKPNALPHALDQNIVVNGLTEKQMTTN